MLEVNKTIVSIEYANSRLEPNFGPTFGQILSAAADNMFRGSIRGNGLGAEGAKHLADGLKINTGLQKLEYAVFLELTLNLAKFDQIGPNFVSSR